MISEEQRLEKGKEGSLPFLRMWCWVSGQKHDIISRTKVTETKRTNLLYFLGMWHL